MLFDFAEDCMFALLGLAVYRLTNAAAPGVVPFFASVSATNQHHECFTS